MRVVFHLADRISVLDRGRFSPKARRRDRRQRGGAGRLSGQGRMSARTRGRRPAHLLRQEPHPARRQPRGRGRRITALLGRNGAGKTTTLRSLMGLTPAREGRIEIFGHDTTRWPPYRIAALGVGYVPGRAAHLPQSDASRKICGAASRTRARGRSSGSSRFSRASPSGETIAAASFRAASRKCWRSAAR